MDLLPNPPQWPTPPQPDPDEMKIFAAVVVAGVAIALVLHAWRSIRQYMLPVAVVALSVMLCGCPPPEPIRAHRCATDDNVRGNCGLCASARVCAWCATDDPAQRGCYDRSQPFECRGVVVRTLEGCEAVPPEEAGL